MLYVLCIMYLSVIINIIPLCSIRSGTQLYISTTRWSSSGHQSIHTTTTTPWSRVLLEKLTGFATSQEIPRILWNPKVHYRTHKSPPPVPSGNSIQSPQPLPTSSRSILILSCHLRLGLPNDLFPSGFPT